MDDKKKWGQEEFYGPDAKRQQVPPGSRASDHVDDFDSALAEPNINAKQFKNETEFIDKRGPLGSGD